MTNDDDQHRWIGSRAGRRGDDRASRTASRDGRTATVGGVIWRILIVPLLICRGRRRVADAKAQKRPSFRNASCPVDVYRACVSRGAQGDLFRADSRVLPPLAKVSLTGIEHVARVFTSVPTLIAHTLMTGPIEGIKHKNPHYLYLLPLKMLGRNGVHMTAALVLAILVPFRAAIVDAVTNALTSVTSSG